MSGADGKRRGGAKVTKVASVSEERARTIRGAVQGSGGDLTVAARLMNLQRCTFDRYVDELGLVGEVRRLADQARGPGVAIRYASGLLDRRDPTTHTVDVPADVGERYTPRRGAKRAPLADRMPGERFAIAIAVRGAWPVAELAPEGVS